ncbi:MAG TPA: neprosin family prolyl endopeptidase [Thermoanaerobaculia bacterium]
MKPTVPLFLAAALLVACNSTRPPATPASASFAGFLAATRTATADAYVGREGFAVADAAELERMRAHLLLLYEGVTSSRVVQDTAGTTFDCIPIEQQPSLRGGKPLLTPPSLTLTSGDASETGPRGAAVQPKGIGCDGGTIPMRRSTLEEMARFRTLHEFLTGDKRDEMVGNVKTHYYAVARQHGVAYGAGADINIWQPAVPANINASSISQLWVVGAADSVTQTAETGWIVYPQKFKTSAPVLFVYWTANSYASGCYNLDCPGFVQTNGNWALGGAIGPISQSGGTQSTMQYAWRRDPAEGAWWLFFGPVGSVQVFGYFPQSLYGTGQMSKHATRVSFGGETVIATPGVPAGQMGSGAFASAGYGQAAFQKNLIYFPTDNAMALVKPTGIQPTPECYTVTVTTDPGLTYMYFGGPQCPP